MHERRASWATVGQQVSLLYDGNQSTGGGGLLARLFDERFDPDPLERRRTVCALAIEGNPHHTLKLKALEAHYRALGARATFLTETAAATEDAVATFYVDETAGGRQHNE